jgi:hypothetical protein
MASHRFVPSPLVLTIEVPAKRNHFIVGDNSAGSNSADMR